MIAKLYYNIKFWYKLKFNRPIYRVDVLKAVKYNYKNCREYGICTSIRNVGINSLKIVFPKLNYFYAASTIGTYGDPDFYWWTINDWTGGRMEFLNWLIKEYKNDKENIKYRIKL
jgi:hypothetical protein